MITKHCYSRLLRKSLYHNSIILNHRLCTRAKRNNLPLQHTKKPLNWYSSISILPVPSFVMRFVLQILVHLIDLSGKLLSLYDSLLELWECRSSYEYWSLHLKLAIHSYSIAIFSLSCDSYLTNLFFISVFHYHNENEIVLRNIELVTEVILWFYHLWKSDYMTQPSDKIGWLSQKTIMRFNME
jgi:hypothetical protein